MYKKTMFVVLFSIALPSANATSSPNFSGTWQGTCLIQDEDGNAIDSYQSTLIIQHSPSTLRMRLQDEQHDNDDFYGFSNKTFSINTLYRYSLSPPYDANIQDHFTSKVSWNEKEQTLEYKVITVTDIPDNLPLTTITAGKMTLEQGKLRLSLRYFYDNMVLFKELAEEAMPVVIECSMDQEL